jgi:outer membrane receptor protein involved in Fe transport
MYQVVDNLSHQAGAHALRVGADFPVQRRHHHLSPLDSRQLYVFVAGEFPAGVYNNAGFTQTSARASCRRPIPISASTRRTMEGQFRRLTLNAGVRYDVQLLESINTDRDNVSPRLGLAWSPFNSRRTWCAAARALLRPRSASRPRERACCRPGTRPTSISSARRA